MCGRISRRRFLSRGLKAGVGICLAPGISGLFGGAIGDAEGGFRDLAVAEGDARKAVREAIESLGGMGRFVKPGDRVLIKPNISFPNPPEWATTTDPAVAKIALRSDVLISVPVAKSHSATVFSGSVKGLMGLVWDRKAMHRGDLDRAIADLSTVIRSDLVVIDATSVLVSGGPSGPGKVARAGTIIAGTDPVKADLCAVKLAERHGLVGASHGVRHLSLMERG